MEGCRGQGAIGERGWGVIGHRGPWVRGGLEGRG